VIYTFTNADDDSPRTIIVEEPKRGGWDLLSPDAEETTSTAYRFETKVPAGESDEVEITFGRTNSQSYGVASYSLDRLMFYVRDGKVSEAVRDAIREAQRLNSLVADAQRKVQETQNEINEIREEQKRIRESLDAIPNNSNTGKELIERYLNTLSEQEDRLAELRDQLRSDRDALQEAQNNLRNYIRNLDVQ
jgi:uncharacterized phage infection (PIP) family protein YhgE